MHGYLPVLTFSGFFGLTIEERSSYGAEERVNLDKVKTGEDWTGKITEDVKGAKKSAPPNQRKWTYSNFFCRCVVLEVASGIYKTNMTGKWRFLL